MQPVWFALSDERPLAFFVGIQTPWGCVRKIKTGWEDCNLYGFLAANVCASVTDAQTGLRR